MRLRRRKGYQHGHPYTTEEIDMRLLYDVDQVPVTIGDVVDLKDGESVEVTYFREPHKPASSGKVSVKYIDSEQTAEFYVSVIGATWIEREDR